MTFLEMVLASFIGFMGGYVVSRTVLYPVETFFSNVNSRIICWAQNRPYVTQDMIDEAEEKLMNNIDSMLANSSDARMLKICPVCVTFKKNFAKTGRKRICMDCEFDA